MPVTKVMGRCNGRVKGPITFYKLEQSSLTKSGKAGGKEPYYPPSVQLHEHAKAYKYITLPHASVTQNLLIFEPFLIFA